MKIEKVIAEATGSVTVGSWSPDGAAPISWDPKHANDKAAFVINGKQVTPTPTPTTPGPKPTSSTSPTATPSTSATPSPGASTGNGKTPNGGLAETGVTAGPILLAGAVLVAAGGAVFLAFRRRTTGRA